MAAHSKNKKCLAGHFWERSCKDLQASKPKERHEALNRIIARPWDTRSGPWRCRLNSRQSSFLRDTCLFLLSGRDRNRLLDMAGAEQLQGTMSPTGDRPAACKRWINSFTVTSILDLIALPRRKVGFIRCKSSINRRRKGLLLEGSISLQY